MKADPLDSTHPALRSLHRSGAYRGFTLLELLIVISVLAVLTAILIPVVSRARAAGKQVVCLNNLHQLAGAFHLYTQENSGLLPDPAASSMSWESSLLPFLTDSTFHCPSDDEIYPAVGSSYDWRDTENAATTLAGVSMTAPKRTNLVLVFESLPGWHGPNKINAATLDGTAAEVDYQACMRDLTTPNSVPILP